MKSLFMVGLVALGLLVAPSPETGFEPHAAEKQQSLLEVAYEAGITSGLKEPEIVQAILLQETNAGAAGSYRVANPGKNAYFGPMQIKLVAARDVLAKWPSMYVDFGFHTRTDDEIKANLILNDRFNIEVAARYLRLLKDRYGIKGRRDLIQAYNRGPNGLAGSNYAYVASAEARLAAWNKTR